MKTILCPTILSIKNYSILKNHLRPKGLEWVFLPWKNGHSINNIFQDCSLSLQDSSLDKLIIEE